VRRARAWIVAGFVVTGAIAVAVGLCEVGLRLFYPQPMGVWFQDRDGLAMHWPGLVTYLPQFGLSVSFNSAGMRDREHTVAKPNGVFRVLVLGDSFMEALQIPFESTFPSLLERGLAGRTGSRIEVVNASVSGWGTDDELKYLATQGRKLRPDLIVVAMTLHNDISDNLRERFHTMQNGALLEKPGEAPAALEYEVIRLKGFLASRSHAYQLLLRARRARERQGQANALNAHVVTLFRETADPRISRGLELTSLLLQRMKTLALADDSRLALVLLPLVVQLSDERFAKFTEAADDSERRFDVERPQVLMRDLGDRAGIDVIDLLPSFRKWTAEDSGSLYLEPDGHWNETGHKLAADVVARELVVRHYVRGGYASSPTTTPRVERRE